MTRKIGQEERLSDLIGQVYDAALDPKLWVGIGSTIARTLNASSTALVVQNPGENPQWLSRTANYTDDMANQYEAHYHKVDEWAIRAARQEVSRIFIGQELISDTEFVRTEYYNDWCREAGNFHLVGSVFGIADGAIGILGVHRPQKANPYTVDDKIATGRLLSHLRRALQVRQRLTNAGIERRAALDTLERTGVATFVVGRDGHLLYASADAERLLREGDVVRVFNGKLVAVSSRGATALAQMILGAVGTAATGGGTVSEALTLERANRLPLTVLVAPFRPARDGLGTESPAALVFIRDPERVSAAGIVLQGLFGLTAMEACIAASLAQGKSLKDITAGLNISINTAKTHLKGILLKTSTRRQAELVALLLRSVAMLGNSARP